MLLKSAVLCAAITWTAVDGAAIIRAQPSASHSVARRNVELLEPCAVYRSDQIIEIFPYRTASDSDVDVCQGRQKATWTDVSDPHSERTYLLTAAFYP